MAGYRRIKNQVRSEDSKERQRHKKRLECISTRLNLIYVKENDAE